MSLKSAIKSRVHGLKLDYERRRFAFDDTDLLAALRDVGVEAGGHVLVHSSLDAFTGYSGKPTDVLRVLSESVGAGGVVLMPTIPFSGTAIEYARSGAVFDVRRTASRMGILPELLRRMPGVTRSLHPTHSVAASGRDAEALTRGHELVDTPCAAASPYGRLVDVDGGSLFMGVDIESMTFFHAIEAWLEPAMPFSPFTEEWFDFECRDRAGETFRVRNRLFEPSVSRRRNLGKLAGELKRAGRWRETRVGKLALTYVRARDALDAARAMSARGEYCYDD